VEGLARTRLASAVSALAAFPAAAVALALPPTCPACRAAIAAPHALCGRCWSSIRFIEPPLCPVYGMPFPHDLGEGAVSAAALADPPPFRRARAAVIYDDVARRLVHRLKYHDRPDMAPLMAKSIHRAARGLLEDCALVVPVPLAPLRLWWRRYNQSAVLAAELSRISGVPVDPLVLVRTKATRPQVGLTATQRAENVRGAFRVPEARRSRIAGLQILLVDDVYTSGATAKAATRALLRAGAAAVDVVTFARVV